ncbi:hypothetical protein E2562_017078 [Oryza meyeriana var. granulata]|uniref:Uncharacterized protein n=1 Tax=Oryza meyeriana var. granulata TaxID=110450 RepID=A0A6G1F901_9ORYZ|nr:hypothetical protein E2562_017078 [Oryza meyeriana var. granulata]
MAGLGGNGALGPSRFQERADEAKPVGEPCCGGAARPDFKRTARPGSVQRKQRKARGENGALKKFLLARKEETGCGKCRFGAVIRLGRKKLGAANAGLER